jgi:hypothetical protein
MVKDIDQKHNTHAGSLGGEKKGKVSYLVHDRKAWSRPCLVLIFPAHPIEGLAGSP